MLKSEAKASEGSLRSKAVERALDRMRTMAQAINERINRDANPMYEFEEEITTGDNLEISLQI